MVDEEVGEIISKYCITDGDIHSQLLIHIWDIPFDISLRIARVIVEHKI
jgi:hypothetical protein